MNKKAEDLELNKCRFCEHYLECKSSDDAESNCNDFQIDERLFEIIEFFDLYK